MSEYNILVVDDEEEICDYLKEIIEGETGHSVRVAYSGEDVDNVVGEDTIHLAFVDLKLATAMGGLDIMRHLKKKFPDIKITAMTGYVDANIKHETETIGVVEFLEKPITPKAIDQLIKDLDL